MNALSTTTASPVLPLYPASYQRDNQRIVLPYLNRTVSVAVDDLVCLQGEGNYTFLISRDGKRYLVSKTLKEFELTLNATQFIRVHKSHIVNLAYVRYSRLFDDRALQMANGQQVPISRRRAKEVFVEIQQYFNDTIN
jgi:two-component system, LytTR family, response regulator